MSGINVKSKRIARLIPIVLGFILLCCLSGVVGVEIGYTTVDRGNVAYAEEGYPTTVAVNNIRLPEELRALFTDYTETELADGYKDGESLENFWKDNALKSTYPDIYERSFKALRGEVRYTPKKEFSTKESEANRLPQEGDLRGYSYNNLLWSFGATDLYPTGIYGFTGSKITVYVDAAPGSKLPEIVISQNHGYLSHWRETGKLQVGVNTLTYSSFKMAHMHDDEILGGAIYIRNPYEKSAQGDVSIYIEGDGFYPVFYRGGDEDKFKKELAEYETLRVSNGLLDMAEMVTDYALISTTSSSLYNAYVAHNVLSPNENLALWGSYFAENMEFNGIATSPDSYFSEYYNEKNSLVKINFRYMSVYSGSGAYSTTDHVAFYDDWFDILANYNDQKYPISSRRTSDRNIFDIGHEIGHVLDTRGRTFAETTNNVNAAHAYMNVMRKMPNTSWQPFSRSLKNLMTDRKIDYNAFDDGRILYNTSTFHDHNFMVWWYLESLHPHYWGELANYYRYTPTRAYISDTEKMIYYSSLITGVDLREYFQRWGAHQYGNSPYKINSSSAAFSNLMGQALSSGDIKKTFDHFWCANSSVYGFMLSHADAPDEERAYNGDIPEVISVSGTDGNRTIAVYSKVRDDNHLGYEILVCADGSTWQTAGFTYSSEFVDDVKYMTEPKYKARAINMYMQASEAGEEGESHTQVAKGVCKIDDKIYATFDSALAECPNGGTIKLLGNCEISGREIVRELTIEVDDSVKGDLKIASAGSSNNSHIHYYGGGTLTIRGRADARIIIDVMFSSDYYSFFFTSGSTIRFEYVVLQNASTTRYPAAIEVDNGALVCIGCEFLNCSSSSEGGAIRVKGSATFKDCAFADNKKDDTYNGADGIYVNGALKIENCTFSGQSTDVYLAGEDTRLTLTGSVPKMRLDFDDFKGSKNINLEGFAPDVDMFDDLTIVKNDYAVKRSASGNIEICAFSFDLTFNLDGRSFQETVNVKFFTFGEEDASSILAENYYISRYALSDGREFHVGDVIELKEDLAFDVEVKRKLRLDVYFADGAKTYYVPENYAFYLPSIDEKNAEVVAYRDVSNTYYSGQTYTVKEDGGALSAVYQGKLAFRCIVDGKVYDVGYGKYGDEIGLARLEEDGFLGWRCGDTLVTDKLTLFGDVELYPIMVDDEDVYDLSACEIVVKDGEYTFTGNAIEPEITVLFGGAIVPAFRYKTSYFDNVDAGGRACIVISAVAGFSSGENTAYFDIAARPLDDGDVWVSGIQNVVYSGERTEQTITVYDGATLLEEGLDYDVSYHGDRVNAGEVRVAIEFKGNYSGRVERTYDILRAQGSAKVSIEDYIFGEEPSKINILSNTNVTDGAEILYKPLVGGEYSAVEPVKAGRYSVKVTLAASQNYDECVAYAEFSILKAERPDVLPESEMTVSRKVARLKEVQLAVGWQWVNPNAPLTEERTVATARYYDADNYENYTAQITVIKEEPKEISLIDALRVDEAEIVYDGKPKAPEILAVDGGIKLVKGIDFNVEYRDNVNAGQAKATVTGIGDYKGSAELGFKINKATRPHVEYTTLKADEMAKTLADVELPTGFVWEDPTAPVIFPNMTATAVYIGDDAANYEYIEVEFVIEEEKEPSAPDAPSGGDGGYNGDVSGADGKENSVRNSKLWLILAPCIVFAAVGICLAVFFLMRKIRR